MRKRTVAILAVIAAVASFVAANADVNYTAGSGTVIFAFTCFTTKVCPAHTPVDTAGATLVGAAGAPTANSLTTQAETLGNGTSANAARVTISSDSTGQVNTLAAAGAAVTMQNAATANGNGVTLAAAGFNTALVNVNCSVACSGGTTVNFEGTDSTGTYFSIAAIPVGSGGAVTSVTNLATNAQYWVPLAALTTIRARISSYSAGTITVTGTPVNGINAALAAIAGTVTTNGSGVTQPVSIASGQAVDGSLVTLGTKADTATCATTNSVIACLRQIDTDVQAGTGATGSAVPAISIYPGINVGGTLRGATGANPSGTIYAQQVDLASVAGTTTATGNGVSGAGTQRVNIASDNSVFTVSADTIVTPSANFTRPANTTAYAAGNLVANSTTAGSVTPMSWTAARVNAGNFYVRRFRMTLSSKSITNTSFRLHLFTVTPATITNGDGGAFNVTTANEFCTMDALVSATDPLNWEAGADVSIGYGVPGKGNECNAVAAGGTTTVFGLLEARAAYTPASGETITVIPEIHQN